MKMILYVTGFVLAVAVISCDAAHDVSNISFDANNAPVKRIESVDAANGGFLVVTDRACFEYTPGVLKVYQVKSSQRHLVATAVFDHNDFFAKSTVASDRALFWSERLNAGVGGDSACMLAAKGDVIVDVTGNFVPLMLAEGDSLFAADASASIHISNNWKYRAKVADATESDWSVSYKLTGNRTLIISVDSMTPGLTETTASNSTGGMTPGSSGGATSGSAGGGASSSSGGAASGSAGGAASGSAGGATSSPDNETASSSIGERHFGSINPTVFVFALPSYQRVLQNELLVSGENSAAISCAKNETESFQILVVNKSYETLWNVRLAFKDWQPSVSGSRAPDITLFREHYVEIRRSSGDRGMKHGSYPDALIPFVNPYTQASIVSAKYLAKPHAIMPSTSQGYWIDIHVGGDVVAGIYQNEIEVFANDIQVASVPVVLTVWDFELPTVQTLKSWFGDVPDISSYHNTGRSSASYKTIEGRYIQMLRQHGAILFHSQEPTMNFGTGAVEFTSWYIAGLRDYVNQVQPMSTYLGSRFDRMKPAQLAKYLTAWEQFIQQNPWIPEPFMLYDEPVTLEAYQKVIEYGSAMHAYAPSIKLLVTEQVEPRKPGWPNLEGYVDIWCPLWFRGNPESLARRQRLGDKAWSYIALTQSMDVPTWLIDFPLLDYRIPAWFSWNLDLEGILYWQTMNWASCKPRVDPWVNGETFAIGEVKWNGEGSLVYPGSAAGIDGPVVSMRLKVFRDGIEDHKYMSLLSGLIGKDEVKKMVSGIAKDFKTYSSNPDDYVGVRQQMAERILLEKSKQ